MSSPTSPISGLAASISPDLSHQPQDLLGFTLSADGKSAEKKFEVDGKKMKIVVVFPLDANENDKQAMLKKFDDSTIQTMGQYSLSIGLTKEKPEKKEKELNAVNFKLSHDGQLIVAKQYKNNTSKEIETDHYENKLQKDKYKEDAPSGLHQKVVEQQKFYQEIAKRLVHPSPTVEPL